MQIDVHQHIWTPPLLEALAARNSGPCVRRQDGTTVLYSNGERPYVIDVESELPEQRARLVRNDGLDLALVAISSPIGIESLPRDDACELIAAHLQGVTALGPEFAWWGAVPLEEPRAGDVDELVTRGCAGVSLPASALADRDSLDATGPLLARIAQHRVPLLVHPGPVRVQHARQAPASAPAWWGALTDYVAQMQAAWLAFACFGRREHPDLAVVFAMLAGGAALLSERLAARGGPSIDLRDPLTFYDSSSYGPAAIDVMAARVGISQLVYGSDRPVIDPVCTGRDALLRANGARVLSPAAVAP